ALGDDLPRVHYKLNLYRAVPSTGTTTVAECDLPSGPVHVTRCGPAESSITASGVGPSELPSIVTLHQPPDAPTLILPLPRGAIATCDVPPPGATFCSVTSKCFFSCGCPMNFVE